MGWDKEFVRGPLFFPIHHIIREREHFIEIFKIQVDGSVLP